jgi:hypothetical protein
MKKKTFNDVDDFKPEYLISEELKVIELEMI